MNYLKTLICCTLLACTMNAQALEFIADTLIAGTDTVIFAAQIPDGYSADAPPALVVAWHQWGGNQNEIFTHTTFANAANERGWILASHAGPTLWHWNNHDAQRHCRIMINWIRDHYPFDRDSIYMIGGSMGGAAGQIWHNNNCGSNDYLIAATAGGSQLIDLQLRANQYLAEGDTNRSMRDLFGGLPGTSDSVDFEYHRASAVYLADTTESPHFNSLTLPVWSRWGASDLEIYAYGYPAEVYQRHRSGPAVLTSFAPSGIVNHGILIMQPEEVLEWLAQFSVNRYPDILSIAADENDDYYYTFAELGDAPYTFGRYSVRKDTITRRLDISLMRNVQELAVDFEFPWSIYDTLWGVWTNEDETIHEPTIVLRRTPLIAEIYRNDGHDVVYSLEDSEAIITLTESGDFVVVFETATSREYFPAQAENFQFERAYPNPFNSSTLLEIESPCATVKPILVYDLQGRLAKQFNATLTPGVNSFRFDGAGLASGVYFVTLQGESTAPLKLMLLK